jgi:hypothetical protein
MSDADSKPKSRYDQLPKMRTPSGRWVYDPAQAQAPEVDAAVIRDLFTEMHHIDAADARDAVPEAVEAAAGVGGAILAAGSDAARAHATATIEPSIVPALPSAPVRITEMVAARTPSTVRANGGAGEATSGSDIESRHANGQTRAGAKAGAASAKASAASAKVGGAGTKPAASDEKATASGEKASGARRRLVVTLGVLGVTCVLVIGALVWGPPTSGQDAAGTGATTSTTGAAGAMGTGGATARSGATGTALAAPTSAPSTSAEHDSGTAPGVSAEPNATASPGSGGAAGGNGGTGSRPSGAGTGGSPGLTTTDDPYVDAAAPRATATPKVTATAVVTAPPSAVPAAPPPSASTPAAGPATQPSAIPSVKPVEGDRVFGR